MAASGKLPLLCQVLAIRSVVRRFTSGAAYPQSGSGKFRTLQMGGLWLMSGEIQTTIFDADPVSDVIDRLSFLDGLDTDAKVEAINAIREVIHKKSPFFSTSI